MTRTQNISNHFVDEYDPTIEDAYRKQVQIDDCVCLLDILDTAGQDCFSAMRESYMRHGGGFMLVYSITDRISFDALVTLREQVHRVKDRDTNQFIPIVMVANKSDMDGDRQVTTAEGKELAKAWKVPFVEVSAKTRTNVDACFFELVRATRKEQKGTDSKLKKSPSKSSLIARKLGAMDDKCTIL